MRNLFSDTPLQIERFHIELIQKASISKRLEIVNSLIKTVYQLSWQGICERYSHETLKERVRRFISLLYGDESLAQQVAERIRLDEIT
jgi:hypothetical protein